MRLSAALTPAALTSAALTALLAVTAGSAPVSANADRLASGEPVVTVTAAEGPIDGAVEATMVIPAPPAAVYSALTECANAPEVFPTLKSCRVLEADPGRAWDVREHKVASWASFLPDMSTVFRSDYEKNRSIVFRLLSGDLQHLTGAWTLEPLKGGTATRVTYRAEVGFHALVPSFLVRQSLAADVPKFLGAIKAESIRRAALSANGKS